MRTGPALLPNWAKTKWARWNLSASLSYNRSNKLQYERRVHTISSGHGPVSQISWLHICWAHRSQVTIDYVIQNRSVTGLSPDLCWESAWIQFEFTTSGAARFKVHHCNVLASLICTSVFCNVPNFLILTLPLRSLGKHEIQCSQIVRQLLLVHKKLLQSAVLQGRGHIDSLHSKTDCRPEEQVYSSNAIKSWYVSKLMYFPNVP